MKIKNLIMKCEPTQIELKNENNHLFIFNPNTKNGEELFDFLLSGLNNNSTNSKFEQVCAKNTHTENLWNSEQLSFLIDFCSLIDDNKIRKEMLKKIPNFLKGGI